MNRLKSIILGSFLATVSIASFSPNANAFVIKVENNRSDHNYIANRRPIRQRWVPGHWERTRHGRHWVPGHYVRY